MFVEFSKMPNTSRVWVYPSERKFNLQEINQITFKIEDFCNTWTTHDKPVVSSFKVEEWFILLFVDETEYDISGCSIDKSILLIQSLGAEYNIDFFNRLNILFVENNMTKLLPLLKFKDVVSLDYIVYNTLIKDKSDFLENWKVPVTTTWLNKFIK